MDNVRVLEKEQVVGFLVVTYESRHFSITPKNSRLNSLLTYFKGPLTFASDENIARYFLKLEVTRAIRTKKKLSSWVLKKL